MAKEKSPTSRSVFSKKGIISSLVLVTQVGAPAVSATASPASQSLSSQSPSGPVLRAKDFSELEILISNQSVQVAMKDWSSRAFLSLVPAISDPAKMRAALLKMRTIVHEEFLTQDLASLSRKSQAEITAAFFSELELYSERVSLLSQAMNRSEDSSIRELAKSVLKGIIERVPKSSRLREYLKSRTFYEVAPTSDQDVEFASALSSLNPTSESKLAILSLAAPK